MPHELLEHLDKAVLSVAHPVWLWAGLALWMPLVAWLFYRQRRSLGTAPRSVGIALVAVRALILLLLVIVLAS
ncbi:MAG: hypothetical protein WCL16_11950, partial [bacterium]